MKWTERPDGQLDRSVLTGFGLAHGEGGRIAARMEYAVVEEQMSGDRPPEAVQLVMTTEAAEALAMELLDAVRRARGHRLS